MNILVLAPHPDDESIGCGGTIRKHALAGDTVHVLFLSSGEKGVHEEYVNQEALNDWNLGNRIVDPFMEVREREAVIALGILDVPEYNLHFARYPDGELNNHLLELQTTITGFFKELKPHVVYTSNGNDTHVDHMAVHKACKEAQPFPYTAPRILSYEVWGVHRNPTVFNDILPYVAHKRAAIREYKSQAYNAFDEAILSLNHYRGLMYGPNKMYVEAFSEE